jgi:YHS domain-containing protein
MTATRLAAVALLLAGAAAAAADPPANDTCPVMPGEKALPEFRAEHDGRTVFFCCAACVREFRADPGPYLKNLPPAPTRAAAPEAAPRPNPAEPTGWEWAGPLLAVAAFCDRHPVPVGAAVAAFLLTATAATSHRRLARRGAAGRGIRLLGVLSRWSTFLLLVAAAVGVDLWRAKDRAEAERDAARRQAAAPGAAAPGDGYRQAEKLLHYSWPQGFHALPKGTSNTYYRGNDERSDKLFNGGNYRTATYHLSLRAADGREVRGGDAAGGPLAVRFELVRAPNTAPQLFSKGQMARAFFSRPDPAQGTKRLTVVRPDWEWAADLPVGTAPADGELRGLWLLFVGSAQDPPALATAGCYHYVQFVLHFRGGKLDDRSAVWMMSVLPSPVLAGPDTDGQWFSDRPIPEIPDGRAATDPKLLGTDRPDGEKK